MKPGLLILAFVSFVVVTVKVADAVKSINWKWHIRRMLTYLAFAHFLYLAPYLSIFIFNLGMGPGWVSAHARELHLVVVVFFLSLFSFVWRRLRERGGRVGPGTIEKLKESIKIASRASKQAAENYEKANERIDGVEEEFQRVVEEIMNRLEEVSGGGEIKAVVKNSSNGGSKSVGRDNRDKSGSRAPELKEGTDGGKDWKELAEEYSWEELAGECKERRKAGCPPRELAEVLRALKKKGCKFGPNKSGGHLYLQVRKYEDNEQKGKSAGRVTEVMEEALKLAGIDF